jgi:hypothetical protein
MLLEFIISNTRLMVLQENVVEAHLVLSDKTKPAKKLSLA